ncbi:MAG: aspartate--tRNA ligase [Candidatus Bostrichicola ureolyticus]|nr:MAG: aspartate--tRNA ligase [Candidatus Bostrichicola ureolyticus]
MYKTHYCGTLRITDIGKSVLLVGWIHKNRNLGSISFIDLRDYYGIVQLTFYKNNPLKEKIIKLGREFIIQIKGKVVERKFKNLNNPTGEIEVLVSEIKILNKSRVPPFLIEDKTDGNDELRMKYRYLDIRRNIIKNKLIFRHEITLIIRKFLSNKGFIEIETPMLIKSTSEGARDFVVPSRINIGKFYSLPQSPQIFKQLLMVGGIDKYFQIVKCFRDEDLRADRQPEFTQIDCEMSFIEPNNIQNIIEELICYIIKNKCGLNISTPFLKISYINAIKMYGSDKPDLRFDIRYCELNNFLKNSGISFFSKKEELIISILIPKYAIYSEIDKLIKYIKEYNKNINYVIWIKYLNNGTFQYPLDIFDKINLKKMVNSINANPGDLLIIITVKSKNIKNIMERLRLKIAIFLKFKFKRFAPLWIVDFPLFELDEKSKKLNFLHHPFTSPKDEDIKYLKNYPKKVFAKSYDLIINGVEIGGGSIRIHKRKLQETVLKCIGLSKDEIYTQFGFLLEALEYGAPPHGGIALGLDRLISTITGNDNIRDFIAFPKNNSGRDTMINSPSVLSLEQLKELNLKFNNRNLK